MPADSFESQIESVFSASGQTATAAIDPFEEQITAAFGQNTERHAAMRYFATQQAANDLPLSSVREYTKGGRWLTAPPDIQQDATAFSEQKDAANQPGILDQFKQAAGIPPDVGVAPGYQDYARKTQHYAALAAKMLQQGESFPDEYAVLESIPDEDRPLFRQILSEMSPAFEKNRRGVADTIAERVARGAKRVGENIYDTGAELLSMASRPIRGFMGGGDIERLRDVRNTQDVRRQGDPASGGGSLLERGAYGAAENIPQLAAYAATGIASGPAAIMLGMTQIFPERKREYMRAGFNERSANIGAATTSAIESVIERAVPAERLAGIVPGVIKSASSAAMRRIGNFLLNWGGEAGEEVIQDASRIATGTYLEAIEPHVDYQTRAEIEQALASVPEMLVTTGLLSGAGAGVNAIRERGQSSPQTPPPSKEELLRGDGVERLVQANPDIAGEIARTAKPSRRQVARAVSPSERWTESERIALSEKIKSYLENKNVIGSDLGNDGAGREPGQYGPTPGERGQSVRYEQQRNEAEPAPPPPADNGHDGYERQSAAPPTQEPAADGFGRSEPAAVTQGREILRPDEEGGQQTGQGQSPGQEEKRVLDQPQPQTGVSLEEEGQKQGQAEGLLNESGNQAQRPEAVAPETPVDTAAAEAEFRAEAERIRKKYTGRLFSTPLDPELVADFGRLAGKAIKLGTLKFRDFVKRLVSQIGKARVSKIAPVIRESWDQAAATDKRLDYSSDVDAILADSDVPDNADYVTARPDKAPDPTSIKNAVVAQERSYREFPPAEEEAARSFGRVWDEAKAKSDDEIDALVDELAGNPRSVDDRQDAMLLRRQIELENKYDAIVARLQDMPDDPATRSELDATETLLAAKLLELYDINKSVGRETARGLNARKMMANREFTLARMLWQKRKAVGRELTAKEREEVAALRAEIAKLTKQLEEHSPGVEATIKTLRKKARSQKKLTPVEARNEAKKLAKDADESFDLNALAHKIALMYVRAGVTEREALIDSVMPHLKEVFPEIDRRQTMDAISGYGVFKELDKEAAKVRLRELKGEMQQLGKLADMAAGTAPQKTGIERREASDEERRLIKLVNEAKKKGGYDTGDPATRLKTALEAVKTRLTNQIKDLEQQISTKQKLVKNKTALNYDDEAKALVKQRDELKSRFDEIFGKPGLTDEQRLSAYKSRSEKAIAELERRIRESDFSQKAKRPPVKLDAEGEKIRYALEKAKADYMRSLIRDQLRRRNIWQKVLGGGAEALNTSRAILTSLDLSAVLRQGGWLSFGHPLKAASAIPAMLKSFVSERAASAVENEIASRNNAPLYQTAKLALTSIHGRLSKMEEQYMSRWAKHIPLVAGSERAYVAFLNRMRADVFDSMWAALPAHERTDNNAKVIANYVNVASGRGDLGKLNAAAVPLATIFFSPRFVVSRFQLLAGQPLYRGGLTVKAAIAKEYARSIVGMGLFLATASAAIKALTNDDDEPIELDPRSSDFGKIRIGKTRVDFLGGLSQALVFSSRIATGETKDSYGDITKLYGKDVPFGGRKVADVMLQFLRSKLSPVAGAATDLAFRENYKGEPTTATDVAKRMIAPIAVSDIYEAIKANGVPSGSALGLLSILGAGVQTYEQKQNPAEHFLSASDKQGLSPDEWVDRYKRAELWVKKNAPDNAGKFRIEALSSEAIAATSEPTKPTAGKNRKELAEANKKKAEAKERATAILSKMGVTRAQLRTILQRTTEYKSDTLNHRAAQYRPKK